MGLPKGVFNIDEKDAADRGPKNTVVESTPEEEGTVRIKAQVSKTNYDFIKKEAKRAGVPISAMTSILLDEAIQNRKLYIEKVLRTV